MGETDWGENWVLFWWAGAMFSKSLMQFFVDGWSCAPSLLFTWGQTMVEVMKKMATSFKRSHAYNAILNSSNPHQAITDPHLRKRLLDTYGQVWVSLLWVNIPFYWVLYTQVSVCALQETISQSCVSSGSAMVGLMATSSKRTYVIPKSAAPRAPVPLAGTR